jgi:hypothetical protein
VPFLTDAGAAFFALPEPVLPVVLRPDAPPPVEDDALVLPVVFTPALTVVFSRASSVFLAVLLAAIHSPSFFRSLQTIRNALKLISIFRSSQR